MHSRRGCEAEYLSVSEDAATIFFAATVFFFLK